MDGEGGYPGDLIATATFTLGRDDGDLSVDYLAVPSKRTPVSLAQNLFFNLAGHNARGIVHALLLRLILIKTFQKFCKVVEQNFS